MNGSEWKWHGFWINGGSGDPAPWMRKTFTLEAVPARAVLHLCGLGWHELYVNGQRADDRVLAPIVSQFDRHASFINYDVAHLLRPGRNAITVLLGNGWYNCKTEEVWHFMHAVWMDSPKMICSLECDGQELLFSDDSWRWAPSPILFNQLRNGETYDARKEIQGCTEAEFDDSGWQNVWYCTPAAGLLREEKAEPCRICATYAGKPFQFGPRTTIFDFGTNLTGWVEIEVEGPAGADVMLVYGERLLDDGDVTQERINTYVKSGEFQTDHYILKGAGREIWHSRFTYHGFRYCRVFSYDKITVHRATAQFVHNDFPNAGRFDSSDSMLNRLQEITRQTYLCNYTGIPTDCPHREKNGWTGDAQLAIETGFWNFDIKKGVDAFEHILADCQRPTGQLPGVAPSSGSEYNWGSGPAWDIYLFEAPFRTLLFSGDDSLFQEMLPRMELYLDYAEGMAHEGGLVDYGLGDWCCSDRSQMTPAELSSSAYYFYALKIISRYRPQYAVRAEEVRQAILRKYPVSGIRHDDGDRTYIATLLYFGILEPEERQAAVEALVRDVRARGHRTGFGILGAKYIPRVLAEYGYADDAFRLITQPEYPGWGYWVNIGATTLREAWTSGSSQNHIMFGDISAWMYQYAAGIVPEADSPGFRRFRIQPRFISDLEHVTAEHETQYGKISVAWRRVDGGVELEAVIPAGTVADVMGEKGLTGTVNRFYAADTALDYAAEVPCGC